MKFETLYCLKDSGKIKKWEINVVKTNDVSLINIETGFLLGKMTKFQVEVSSGKNKGKTNETDFYTQAISDAQSKWNKKLKEGYTTDISGEKKTLVKPMLAKNYKDQSKKIIFPCFVQRKYDGLRCVYENKQFHSRTLEIFPNLNFILEELTDTPFILDGELYSHELTFEEISGIIRKEKLNEMDKQKIKKIKFIVYDNVVQQDFETRNKQLHLFLSNKAFKYTIYTETLICKTKEEIDEYHDLFVKEGYEGLIIRNKKGFYQCNKRSDNLLKLKNFDDSEFKIIGFTSGVGKEKDAVIWKLSTHSGQYFDARPTGSIEERKKVFKDAQKYIGKYLTVKYFGVSDDLKIPRFPVAQLYPRIDY
jgi:ATP-dependent DNA ligase